jgi:predicted DNA-binding transcriptional regulator YafY
MSKYKETDRLVRLKNLVVEPKTMAQLMSRLKVTERSIYRYFDRLKKWGYKVVKLDDSSPPKYVLFSERAKTNPIPDLEKLVVLRDLLSEPRTMVELTQELDLKERTIFRNFERLKELWDLDVVRMGITRPTQYVLWSE